MREHLKKVPCMSETSARGYFFQICKAINYLHQIGIAHRDIKLENFLFTSTKKDIVKLIDFGLAENFQGRHMNHYIGTPYYVSPEILMKLPYDEKCDIWSLGVSLVRALTGSYPFTGNDFSDLV